MKQVGYSVIVERDIRELRKIMEQTYGIRELTEKQVITHVILKCPLHRNSLISAGKNMLIFPTKSVLLEVDDDIGQRLQDIAKDLKIKDTKVVLSCLIRLLINLYRIKFADFSNVQFNFD